MWLMKWWLNVKLTLPVSLGHGSNSLWQIYEKKSKDVPFRQLLFDKMVKCETNSFVEGEENDFFSFIKPASAATLHQYHFLIHKYVELAKPSPIRARAELQHPSGQSQAIIHPSTEKKLGRGEEILGNTEERHRESRLAKQSLSRNNLK